MVWCVTAKISLQSHVLKQMSMQFDMHSAPMTSQLLLFRRWCNLRYFPVCLLVFQVLVIADLISLKHKDAHVPNMSITTVKPLLMTTCIQRPPVFKYHLEKSPPPLPTECVSSLLPRPLAIHSIRHVPWLVLHCTDHAKPLKLCHYGHSKKCSDDVSPIMVREALQRVSPWVGIQVVCKAHNRLRSSFINNDFPINNSLLYPVFQKWGHPIMILKTIQGRN